jgi:hypothetical protein
VMPCLNGAIVAYARDHPYTTLSVRQIRKRLRQAAARAYHAQVLEVRSDRRSNSLSAAGSATLVGEPVRISTPASSTHRPEAHPV